MPVGIEDRVLVQDVTGCDIGAVEASEGLVGGHRRVKIERESHVLRVEDLVGLDLLPYVLGAIFCCGAYI